MYLLIVRLYLRPRTPTHSRPPRHRPLTLFAVDDTHAGKYTPQQRSAQRAAFYQRLLAEPTTIEPPTSPSHFNSSSSSSGSSSGGTKTANKAKLTLTVAADALMLSGDELLPPIALERLDVHHELAAVKYAHPTAWKREVWTHVDTCHLLMN